jgi:hypothetical protein
MITVLEDFSKGDKLCERIVQFGSDVPGRESGVPVAVAPNFSRSVPALDNV